MEALEAMATEEDEAAFVWASAALGWVRARGRKRLERAMAPVVEDLAFGLGAWEAHRASLARYGRGPRARTPEGEEVAPSSRETFAAMEAGSAQNYSRNLLRRDVP